MTYEQAKRLVTERLEIIGVDQTEEQIAEMAAMLAEISVQDYAELAKNTEQYRQEPDSFVAAFGKGN